MKKRLLKTKWENIFLILFIPTGIWAMISHNQTDIKLIIAEMFIYIGVPLALRYCIKDMRKEVLYELKNNKI